MENSYIEHINIQVNKILFDEYKRLGINEASLVVLLKIIDASQDKIYQLDVERLEAVTTLPHPEILSIIQDLIGRELIHMSTHRTDGQYQEVIDVSGVYVQLAALMMRKEEEASNDLRDLFSYIENLYGRALSATDYQRLNSWLEHEEINALSVKEAVDLAYKNQITSLQYVERILQNTKSRNQEESDELPMMDWLKGDTH